MTSLAKQLQRLAVPHTQTLFAEDKRKASLLFEPKEAASLDKETFFAIGINGLEELENIDASFQEYKNTLFNETSQGFERSVQTKEVNENLDKTIQEFLIRVSPYFLLRPSLKALEWLVHRYHIHQYNVDDLIMCILPYHETKGFVRALQLLKISEPTGRWNWLEPIQKPGVPLARSTVITHCYKDPGFMHFVCEMVPKFLKVHGTKVAVNSPLRVLFSFYASTVVGAIENCGKVKESMVSQLLPYIVKGLKSKNHDYKAASYMILSQLASRAHLKTEFVETIMPVVTKHAPAKLAMEAISCLLVLFQSQKIDKLPKKCFKHICKTPGIVSTFYKISTQYITKPLLVPFLTRLIPAAVKDTGTMTTSSDGGAEDMIPGPPPYASLLEGILIDIVLEDDIASSVISMLLHEYLSYKSKLMDSDESLMALNDRMKEFIRVLERRYPVVMDTVINQALKDHDASEQQEMIQQFVCLSLSSTKHQIIPDSKTSLMLSLNHPQQQIRQLAIKHLGEAYKAKSAEEDISFFKAALLNRLKEDSCEVVLAVLEQKQMLVDVIPSEELIDELFTILNKKFKKSKSRSKVGKAILLILMEMMPGIADEVELRQVFLKTAVFLFIITTKLAEFEDSLVNVLTTLSKRFKVYGTLLTALKQQEATKIDNPTSDELPSQSRQVLVETLAAALEKMSAVEKRKWVNQLVQLASAQGENPVLIQYSVLCVLSKWMTNTVNTNVRTELAGKALDILGSWNFMEESCSKPTYSLQKCVANFKDQKIIYDSNISSLRGKSQYPVQFVVGLVNCIIQSLSVPQKLKGSKWWLWTGSENSEDTFFYVLLNLFNMLTGAVAANPDNSVLKELLQVFFQILFKTSEELFTFLSSVWSCSSLPSMCPVTIVQARALNIGNVNLSVLQEDVAAVLASTESAVVPSLVFALSSPLAPIRQMALQCIKTLRSKSKVSSSAYQCLMKKLVKCREELIADDHYLCQIFGAFFSNTFPQQSVSDSKSAKLSEKQQARKLALEALLKCVMDGKTPDHIKAGLLQCLNQVNDKFVLEVLLPLLNTLLTKIDKATAVTPSQCLIIQLIIQKFTSETTVLMTDVNSACVELFTRVLEIDRELCAGFGSLQTTALEQMDKAFFSSIPCQSVQQHLLSTLMDLLVDSDNAMVSGNITKVLKGFSLNSEMVVVELNKINQSTEIKTVREVKRARRQSRPASELESTSTPVIETRPWKRVVLMLETLQNKKKLKNVQLLIPVMFGLISKSMEVEDQNSTEYIKQLLLSCIYSFCKKLSPEGKPVDPGILNEQQFNVELIVQCIRSSENPQTHRHALLLLSVAAGMFPDHVLHNIMSVFTFMGANIVRQDDSYSFQVITKTVETIIPALIMASNSKSGSDSDKLNKVVADILRVFVDARPHIPQHRCTPLFVKLMETVGEAKYLWVTLVLLFEHFVSKEQEPKENRPPGYISPDVEFCLTFAHQFPPRIQVMAAKKLMKYLGSLPEDKDEEQVTIRKTPRKAKKTQEETSNVLFNVASHTGKQLRHFKFTVISYIASLLSSETFISQVVQLDSKDSQAMQTAYQTLLEENLRYVTQVAQSVERHATKNTTRFWRALLHKAYDVLEKVNSLLPGNVFIAVVTGLMQNELATVRRKAMDLLNVKLQQQREDFTDQEVEMLLKLVDQLLSVVTATGHKTAEEEQAINRQTAFYSLKLLCKWLGHSHPSNFKKVFDVSTQVFTSPTSAPAIASSSLLCLAELCTCLKAHAIPHLPQFMPGLLKVLQNDEKLLSNDLLLLSAVTTLHKVVDSLPFFLSPYLMDIITKVVILSGLEGEEQSTNQKSQLQLRLKAVRHNISTVLPPRVLLPAILQCYENTAVGQKSTLGPLMFILEHHLSNISMEDLTSHHNQIVNFFLTVLDFRTNNKELPMATVLETEDQIIQAVIAMVMRLSETSFRPMFFKLFDWARRVDVSKERFLTFYRLADRIADRLKGLFTLFAGHIVKNAANLLDENNASKTDSFFGDDQHADEKSNCLIQYILNCLHKCFLYDNDNFVNKERFDTLMQPLVDQIENLQGSDSDYQTRVMTHVVPCVGQMAVAAGDDAMWKTLNYQVCLKTRHASAKVRFAALKVLEALNKNLGEDYMTLLPETIPFLAELMEDESSEVEQECQSVIRQMETVLGEPLQKYF